MKVKTLLAAIILAMLSTTGYNLNAQDDDFDCRAAIREMRTEYYENNIKPQKDEWRAEIDNALSSEDKAKLDRLRAEMTKIRKDMSAKIERLRNSDLDRREIRKAMRDIRKDYITQIRKIRTEVREIWTKYNDLLERIRKEKYEMADKWRTDMQNMMERFCEAHPECCEGRRDDDRRGNGRKGGRRGMDDRNMDRDARDMGHRGMIDRMDNAGFEGKRMGHFGSGSDNMMEVWLYDGSDFNTTEQAMSINLVPMSLNMIAAPNPADNTTNISFNLENSMNTKLIVTDINGSVIKVLHTGNLNAGNHSYSFNTGELTAGTYIYRLETDRFTKTEKIIVK